MPRFRVEVTHTDRYVYVVDAVGVSAVHDMFEDDAFVSSVEPVEEFWGESEVVSVREI
jgi:hypothetical protein